MQLTNNPGGQASFKGFCDHCSNTTFQTIVALETVMLDGAKLVSYTLSRCTICDGISLRLHNTSILVTQPIPGSVSKVQDISFEQVWPPSSIFSSDVPERIRTIYEEARLVKRRSPSSFVVQLRRAFEALAKDRKAEGRDLYRQIQWLIEQEQLPNMFAEMMDIARMIGNAGAHDSETDVTPEDAQVSDRFFKAIVEYLYVAPALLAKARKAKDAPDSDH
jgi:hypothetical protein